MKKLVCFSFTFLVFLGVFLATSSPARAEISQLKDTISTSRPSAVSTLNLGATAGTEQVTINAAGTRFIASDSARLVGGTLEIVTVASMSAASGSTAALYFTSKTTQNHAIGSSVMASVPARHVISFQENNVPDSGNIQVIFPVGDTTNPSYPSPSGFSFNGLASGDLSASFSPAGPTCSWAITPASGLVQCNIGTGITGVTTVTINIGLTTTNPVLVNPSKTASAGTQDSWTVQVKTNDASSREIDSAKTKIATIDAVEVYALIDPYITINIAGLSNSQDVNVGNTSGCTNTEHLNSGFNSTPTEVNLGVLDASQINLGAQLLTVTTNGMFGYSLTATSSGHLIDDSTGYFLTDAQTTPTANDTPDPAALTTGSTAFGIHACGQDVDTVHPNDWGTGATGGGANALYANPSAAYYYTLASDSSGPVGPGTGDGYGDGLVTVEYAATIAAIVPAGSYHTVMTYVATATF